MQPVLGVVDGLPGDAALLGGKPAERLEALGEHALLAEVAHPHGVELREVGGLRDLLIGLGDDVDQRVHVQLRRRLLAVKPYKGRHAAGLARQRGGCSWKPGFGAPPPRPSRPRERRPGAGANLSGGRQASLGLLGQGRERRLVEYRHVRQDLAVDEDLSLLQAAHETAVGQAVLARTPR